MAKNLETMSGEELKAYAKAQGLLACQAQSVNLPRAAVKHWRNADKALRIANRLTERAAFVQAVR